MECDRERDGRRTAERWSPHGHVSATLGLAALAGPWLESHTSQQTPSTECLSSRMQLAGMPHR